MSLKSISEAPRFTLPAALQSTPDSFANLPPALRLHLENVKVYVSNGLEGQGSLWLTEKEVSFLSSSHGVGFELAYPQISLHAVTRSPPEGLTGGSQGCLYCQLDLSTEDVEEDEDSFLEMHIFTSDDERLDQLFESLSQCASLHPSAGGDESHPFASFAPFGNGADGAFDDAEEEEEMSQAGRRTLTHLESVMEWPEEPTNTLILSNLPIEFFVPSICSALLSLLNAYGALVRWTPFPSVGRAVVVFEEAQGAKAAKEGLDRLLLPFEEESRDQDGLIRADKDANFDETILRAVYGPNTSPEEAEVSNLSVPVTDKNFLISPPGSPPIGWEPIREDPPNRDTLADDLMRALGELRDTQSYIDSHKPAQWTQGSPSEPEVILAPHTARAHKSNTPSWQGDTIQVPGVTIQSMDSGEEGNRTHLGVSISSVKATVESMRGAPNLGQDGGQRITPTGRPPLA